MMRSNLFTIAALLLLGVAFVAAQYQSCGGTSVFKNTPYGVISDHTGATNYSHPQYCIWRILPNSTDDRSQVAIQFDYFDSWGNVSANWFDFLLVKDGPGVNSPDLVWFFGQTVPPVVLSSGNAMTLIWYTYNWPGSNTGKGFQLQFSSSSCPSQCNWQNNQGYCFNGTCNCAGGWRGIACDQPYCANNCGGSARGTCSNGRCQCKPGFYGADCSAPACDRLTVFTDSSVANFSDHHASISGKNEYEHAANCSWLIQPKDAQLIRLKFLSFDLEENWDYVYVYDGPTTDSPHKAFTGSTIPPEFVSTGSSLLLVFVSDTGVASTGFTATYSSVSASSGSSAIGYLATAFVCLLLGAVLGVVSYIYYNKWQEKKSDVHYGVVPTDDGGDLLGDDI